LKAPKAKTLILTVTQEEESSSMHLKGGLLRFLSLSSRFWAYRLKITPNVWPEIFSQ
jgi:hypothetical protein